MLKRGDRLLFLCTGNSCRSQMAEGWARHLLGDAVTVRSAGVEAHGMNEMAVAVMREAGVDLSSHRSRRLDELDDPEFDLVITVCGNAHERCPTFPGNTRVVHRGFDDPPFLARGLADREAALDIYRRVRDEIRDHVKSLASSLREDPSGELRGESA